MGFLDDYEPVEARLVRFWQLYPNGRIITHLVEHENGEWVFRAEAYRDAEDERPFATGYAHEVTTARGVNSTSAAENGETSAIGRAMANGGMQSTKAKRPSRQEMEKAQRGPAKPAPKPADPALSLDDVKRRIGALPDADKKRLKEQFGWPPANLEDLLAAVIECELTAQASF